MKKTELLAPAGSPEVALAAFDAGADAVYAGLDKFNARERADNFSVDSMGRLISHAHQNGRRVYVTVNTLIKENELPEMMVYLGELAKLAPDAVIVQDLGVLRMLREYYPNLTIHASTQMGFHNSAGIALAARLGVKRVILERQLTMAEIGSISRQSPIELEVFIHGALCCSLSGRCLLSSWLGSWSGNRGKCKQPCRRLYEHERGKGFVLSPMDLCGVEQVADFIRMGIASFKIEGRLRRPDYVWKTVSAYRMLIDSNGEKVAEASQILNSTAAREFSPGFYPAMGHKKVIASGNIGVFGKKVGEIGQVRGDGFMINAESRIHVGDRFRAVPPNGDEGFAFTIIKMSMNGKPVLKISQGQSGFVPGDYPEAKRAWPVYKIGENGFDFSARAAALPPFRHPLEVAVKVDTGYIEAQITSPVKLSWRQEQQFAAAVKQPLDHQRLAEEFASGCPESFRADKVAAEVTAPVFIPASELKQLRRQFWQYIGEQLNPDDLADAIHQAQMKFYQDYQALAPAGETDVSDKPFMELPPFCPEDQLPNLRKDIKKAYETDGVRNFRVAGVYGLELLRSYRDINIYAVFPLPVCNSLAALELKASGVKRYQPWIELDQAALDQLLSKSPLSSTTVEIDRPDLLVSRAVVPARGTLRDNRGNAFNVSAYSGLSVIKPVEGTSKRFRKTELK